MKLKFGQSINYLLNILRKITLRIWFNRCYPKIKKLDLKLENIILIEIDDDYIDEILNSNFLKLFYCNIILIINIKSHSPTVSGGMNVYKILVTLSPRNLTFFRKEYKNIISLYTFYINTLLILIPPKEPPKFKTRFNDGKVTFLMCDYSSEIENVVNNNSPDANLINLCFNITKYIVDNKNIEGLIIRQFDDLEISKDNTNSIDKRIILPHKGNLNYLESCLNFLLKNNNELTDICVCFDEELTDLHSELIKKYTNEIKFYKLSPHSVGPYVSRQLLAESSNNSYLTFQDSDDVPTFDRLNAISEYINLNPNVDWFGSQSIRLNEFTDAIDILRYPIDVTEALNKSDDYCLLLPSSTIKNDKFKEVGGFSTVRKMASDRQFLYLSHIKKLNMKNINKYLYLRRRRKHSLTMSPDTGFGSDQRSSLQELWKNDFDKIKRNEIKLEDSSLNKETLDNQIDIVSLN